MRVIKTEGDKRFADFARRGLNFCETDKSYSRRRIEVERGEIEEGPQLTQADKLAMLVAFCGLWTEDKKIAKKTFCLGFEDLATGRLVYQTVPVQDFHYSPFVLASYDEARRIAVVEYRNKMDSDRFLSWQLPLGGNFLRYSNHHFNQFDRQMNLLPVSIIANPRPFCAEACPGCSRVALGADTVQLKNEYIEEHTRQVAEDFEKKFHGVPHSALKYVSVSTGCQQTRNEEIQMFLKLISCYRRHGFSPDFLFFSNRISRYEDLYRLKDAGAIGIVSPIECFNDILRERIWGGKKGSKSFLQHLRVLVKAIRIFTIAEASFVFGHDAYEELLDGIRILGNMGASIVGNIARLYNEKQVEAVHPDVWEMGLEYFVKVFEVAVRLNQENYPSALHLRKMAVSYLTAQLGQAVPDYEFPYKYRG